MISNIGQSQSSSAVNPRINPITLVRKMKSSGIFDIARPSNKTRVECYIVREYDQKRSYDYYKEQLIL